MTEITVGECHDCKRQQPLETYGSLSLCPLCILSRRRVQRIVDGQPRHPPPEPRRGDPVRFVPRWHTYPDLEPLTAEALNQLRKQTLLISADGNWAELWDDEGNLMLVIVRIHVARRPKPQTLSA